MKYFVSLLVVGLVAASAHADEDFEKAVRPLLIDHCVKCHGGAKTGGGLDVTSRELILQGGESGPAVVVGKPDESLLVKSVRHAAGVKQMPKKADKLTDREIETLARWVQNGLPWLGPAIGDTATRPTGKATDEQRRWWAYQPLRPVAPPAVKDDRWPQSPIDRFILAELEARGRTPAAAADKRILLRRATFDLTGLPPTPAEIDAFLKDDRADAFARVVDRLLAAPAYGERWGRHWLDVARFTDYYQKNPREHGQSASFELFEAYRYRDWVVTAFNRDLPYDQFVRQQIAGDLLPESPHVEGTIATGFLTIGSWDFGDADKEKLVSDIVDDQIDAVGKAFLGLTLSCARCHDHKFDPISTEDYYGLAGIFYSTRTLAGLGGKGAESIIERVPLVPPEDVKKRDALLAEIQRVGDQLRVAGARSAAALLVPRSLLGSGLPWAEQAAGFVRQRDQLTRKLLPAPPLALGVQEGGTPGSLFPGMQDVKLHIRGSYTRLGPVVKRRLPQFFAGTGQPEITGSGRLQLAQWVASPDNPLTARVLVNRVWQHHFGEGIVRTPSNFGKLGDPPSHPQLLDWLALQFIQDGWSIKQLQRRIMLSAAYQQASTVPPEAARQDPENRWLGRMNPRRLEAEAVRDAMLAASGRLERTPGGPATVDLDTPRRSLYVATTRWDRTNFSTLFDAANPDQSVEKRGNSTSAPQALFLLNSPFARTQAKRIADRLRADGTDDDARIRRAYELLYARPPSGDERRLGLRFVAAVGWADYVHVLLCGNEFAYLD